MPKQFKFLKWNGKKAAALLVLTCVLAAATIGGTVAFIVTKTQSVENVFLPATVESAVKNSQIQNTGDANVYIRAIVVVTWVSEDDSATHAQKPVLGNDGDYTISYSNTNWVLGDDGFYYYINPLVPNATTEALITSCTQTKGAPDGYKLKVQVIASAIQAEPISVVETQWGVIVAADGTITP